MVGALYSCKVLAGPKELYLENLGCIIGGPLDFLLHTAFSSQLAICCVVLSSLWIHQGEEFYSDANTHYHNR